MVERSERSTKSRAKYSRLICLGCRQRRIRCELPSDVETPGPGELRTVSTPCYRCRRLRIPCVIRQTILGRPGTERTPAVWTDCESPDSLDPIVKAPKDGASQLLDRSGNGSSDGSSPNLEDSMYAAGNTLSIHEPHSTETVLIIRAIDTIRRERCEREWFRHLAPQIGHNACLDLSIKALVAACAYARGVPKLTFTECYQALALALTAVQVEFKQSQGQPTDYMLASAALLAPFEAVVSDHGFPSRLHIEGLAANLAARSSTDSPTPLAREILDFFIWETTIMASVRGTCSPFESVNRAYFANARMGCYDHARSQLRALGNELSIRNPRLVLLLRSLRSQHHLQPHLLSEALLLSQSLRLLEDAEAEESLLRKAKIYPSTQPYAPSPLHQSFHFSSLKDYDALACYWINRLFALRLERRLHDLLVSSALQVATTEDTSMPLRPTFGPKTDETSRLATNVLMCLEYGSELMLRKHEHLTAHAVMVLWGVAMDTPELLISGRQDVDLFCLFDHLLRVINKALGVKPELTFEDMNICADIFVGGEPGGRFTELYGS